MAPNSLDFSGVIGIQFPLLDDRNGTISRLYGVDNEVAGTVFFIVSPGEVRKTNCGDDIDDAIGCGGS